MREKFIRISWCAGLASISMAMGISAVSVQASGRVSPQSAPHLPSQLSGQLSPEEELLRAYQREYAFLAAQKETLARQKRAAFETLRRRVEESESAVRELERGLVRAQSKNEALFGEAQSLEKRQKEEQGRVASMQATWKRARRSLHDAESQLHFDSESSESREVDLTPPEKISVADLAAQGKRGIRLAEAGSGWARQRGSFVDRDGNLVDGTIVRVGRVAAYGRNGDRFSLLGPGSEGVLREVDEDTSGTARSLIDGVWPKDGLTPVYLFESMSERAQVRKTAGFIDRAASAVPALLLAMLFGIVLWLFGALARL